MADIIFATAMTIMVLSIEVPGFGNLSGKEKVAPFLIEQLKNMWAFIISFLIVAIYWTKHLELFGSVKVINKTFIWLQLGFLAAVLLIPFWNTYLEQNPENVAIRVGMSVNILLVGGLSYFSLNYASNPKHYLLHEDVPKGIVRIYKREMLTEPMLAILGAALAFINPYLWDVAFLLIPVAFLIAEKLKKRKIREVLQTVNV